MNILCFLALLIGQSAGARTILAYSALGGSVWMDDLIPVPSTVLVDTVTATVILNVCPKPGCGREGVMLGHTLERRCLSGTTTYMMEIQERKNDGHWERASGFGIDWMDSPKTVAQGALRWVWAQRIHPDLGVTFTSWRCKEESNTTVIQYACPAHHVWYVDAEEVK